MSKPRKITHYIPHSIPINSFSSQKDFLRKRPSKVVQIKLADTLKSYTFPSFSKYSHSTRLLKLFKRVKQLKSLKFNHHVLIKYKFTVPSMLSFVKSIRRIREIIIKEVQVKQENLKTQLPLWLKYAISLKNLTFDLDEFTPESKRFFRDQVSPFLHNLRYQNRMKSLDFQLPTKISFVRSIFLQLHQYPSSLQKLKFSCKGGKPFNCVDKNACILSPLSSFKKLDIFALQITQDQNIINNLMGILPSLSHLKSLDLLLPDLSVFSKSSQYENTVSPQIFCKLRHLSLTILEENPYTFFFAALDLSNLQSLQLSTQLISLKRNKELFKILSKMKNLQALEISIANVSQLGELLKAFFKNITKLKKLTSLKVSFFGSVIEEIPSEILESLKEVFQKLIKIKEFALECSELLISTKLPGLLKIFTESASTLRKFKLKTVPVTLESKQMKPLAKFFESLENVQVLKLPCLNFDSDSHLTKITCMILKLKQIRSVCLGKIGDKTNGGVFLGNVKRVIEKKGVERFECETSEEFKRVLRIPFTGSISFERTTKKNPFLKSLSKDLLTLLNFKGYL